MAISNIKEVDNWTLVNTNVAYYKSHCESRNVLLGEMKQPLQVLLPRGGFQVGSGLNTTNRPGKGNVSNTTKTLGFPPQFSYVSFVDLLWDGYSSI